MGPGLPAPPDKRLEFWLELAPGVTLTKSPELETAVLDELGRVNQDFREAARMIPEGRRPTLELFPFGASPISGQDIRIKRRYIV